MTTTTETLASYTERMTTGDLAEAAGYRADTIAPTESARDYGRRTAIVEPEAIYGPPEPLSHVFTGEAAHPFAPSLATRLIGRCRHCWGERSQHTYGR